MLVAILVGGPMVLAVGLGAWRWRKMRSARGTKKVGVMHFAKPSVQTGPPAPPSGAAAGILPAEPVMFRPAVQTTREVLIEPKTQLPYPKNDGLGEFATREVLIEPKAPPPYVTNYGRGAAATIARGGLFAPATLKPSALVLAGETPPVRPNNTYEL